MVFPRGANPVAEPRANAFEAPFSLCWMGLERFPFFVCGPTFFVQQTCGNGQFANIVKERAPSEKFSIFRRQSEFLGNYITKCTYFFRVTTGATVVFVEFFDQHKYLFGGNLGIERQPVFPEACRDSFSICGVADAQCQLHAIWGFDREGQV
jgi:hypothetical protein